MCHPFNDPDPDPDPVPIPIDPQSAPFRIRSASVSVFVSVSVSKLVLKILARTQIVAPASRGRRNGPRRDRRRRYVGVENGTEVFGSERPPKVQLPLIGERATSASCNIPDSRKIFVCGHFSCGGAGAAKSRDPLWGRRPRRPGVAKGRSTFVPGCRVLQKTHVLRSCRYEDLDRRICRLRGDRRKPPGLPQQPRLFPIPLSGRDEGVHRHARNSRRKTVRLTEFGWNDRLESIFNTHFNDILSPPA